MILSRVKDYLRQRGRARVDDLALDLDAAPQAIEAMLVMLERKGQVRRLPDSGPCGGCSKCERRSAAVYEWAGG